MAKKPKVDTEPDDAFAAVLGDIDGSPLMRKPEVSASPAFPTSQIGEKKTGKPRSKPKKAQNSKPAPRKKNPTQKPVQDKAPDQSPGQPMSQGAPETGDGLEIEAADTAWSARQEDGCAVLSPPDFQVVEAGAETPAQLRALLLELLDKDTSRFRIDLAATPHLDASSLAVLLSFASLLGQRQEGIRLEIAAQGDLAQFFCLCKVEETHPITLVED